MCVCVEGGRGGGIGWWALPRSHVERWKDLPSQKGQHGVVEAVFEAVLSSKLRRCRHRRLRGPGRVCGPKTQFVARGPGRVCGPKTRFVAKGPGRVCGRWHREVFYSLLSRSAASLPPQVALLPLRA